MTFYICKGLKGKKKFVLITTAVYNTCHAPNQVESNNICKKIYKCL